MRACKKKKRPTSSEYPPEIAITSILEEMEMCGDGGGCRGMLWLPEALFPTGTDPAWEKRVPK